MNPLAEVGHYRFDVIRISSTPLLLVLAAGLVPGCDDDPSSTPSTARNADAPEYPESPDDPESSDELTAYDVVAVHHVPSGTLAIIPDYRDVVAEMFRLKWLNERAVRLDSGDVVEVIFLDEEEMPTFVAEFEDEDGRAYQLYRDAACPTLEEPDPECENIEDEDVDFRSYRLSRRAAPTCERGEGFCIHEWGVTETVEQFSRRDCKGIVYDIFWDKGWQCDPTL